MPMAMQTFMKSLAMNTNNLLYIITLSIAICFSACEEEDLANSLNTANECHETLIADFDTQWTYDPIYINEASLNDSILELNISHSGGCAEHDYQLIQEPLFCGTPPVFIIIRLSHDSNNDMCEALITKTLCYNLSSLYENFSQDDISIGLYNIHQPDTSWVFQ